MDALAALVSLLVAGAVTWRLLETMLRTRAGGEVTGVLGLPLYPAVGVAGAGFALFALALLVGLTGPQEPWETRGPRAQEGPVMAPEVVGLLALAALLVLLALRVPVGLSMILVATCGQAALLNGGAALARLGLDTFGIVSNARLSVIPLFVLMGLFLSRARLGTDLYRFAAALLGNVRGALAMATIGASALFAAVSGSAVATTLTMAVVTVPEMRRYRYDDRLSAPAAAVGGTLGILMPPSGMLVLYGLLTQESIGSVLVAGALPGLLTAALLMLAAYLVARRNPAWAPRVGPAAGSARSLRRLPGLRTIWVVPAVFGLSMGGLYLGVFTPTEAGAVGAFLAVVFGVATRRLGWAGLCGRGGADRPPLRRAVPDPDRRHDVRLLPDPDAHPGRPGPLRRRPAAGPAADRGGDLPDLLRHGGPDGGDRHPGDHDAHRLPGRHRPGLRRRLVRRDEHHDAPDRPPHAARRAAQLRHQLGHRRPPGQGLPRGDARSG